MPQTLESSAMDPFQNWSDWHGGGAVVTIMTMSHYLWSQYSQEVIRVVHHDHDHDDIMTAANCDDMVRLVIHEMFTANDLEEPGIRKDREDSYTIVIPRDFMTPELCEEWIAKLNDEYDEDFELSYTDIQTQRGEMQTFFDTGQTCPNCGKAMVEGRTKKLSGRGNHETGDEVKIDGVENLDVRITDAIGYCAGCGEHMDVDIIIEDGTFCGLDI